MSETAEHSPIFQILSRLIVQNFADLLRCGAGIAKIDPDIVAATPGQKAADQRFRRHFATVLPGIDLLPICIFHQQVKLNGGVLRSLKFPLEASAAAGEALAQLIQAHFPFNSNGQA